MFTKNQRYKIKYSLEHRKAFLDLEKKLLGKNTVRGYLHDLDKIILYHFLPVKAGQNLRPDRDKLSGYLIPNLVLQRIKNLPFYQSIRYM